MHEATPEVPSSPVAEYGTGLVYQPFASGPRERPRATPGGDESFLITTKFETVAKDVDLVLDTVGGETLARSIAVVKPGGMVVSITGAPDPKALEARGVRGKRMIGHPDAAALAELAALVEAKRLAPVVSQVHALADGAKAHQAVATGHTRGKIVLRVLQ